MSDCGDTDFERTVLRERHRSVQQEADEFEYQAFTPVLSVAGAHDVAVFPEVAQDLRASNRCWFEGYWKDVLRLGTNS